MLSLQWFGKNRRLLPRYPEATCAQRIKMDLSTVERLTERVKGYLKEAARHQANGDVVQMHAAAETAVSHVQWIRQEGYRSGLLDQMIRDALRFLAYNEADIEEAVASPTASAWKKVKKKRTAKQGSPRRPRKLATRFRALPVSEGDAFLLNIPDGDYLVDGGVDMDGSLGKLLQGAGP